MRDPDAKVFHLSERDMYALIQDFNEWCKCNGRLFTPGTRIQWDVKDWLTSSGARAFTRAEPQEAGRCAECGRTVWSDNPIYYVMSAAGHRMVCSLCAIDSPGAVLTDVSQVPAPATAEADDDENEIPF